MASNPSVICWDGGQHGGMVAFAIIGLLCYPVLILGIIGQVTWRYPGLIASGAGLQTLQRYRFLFHRFVPARYYWGFFYLMRNFLLSLTPVIFRTSAIWQMLVIDALLLAGLVFTAHLMPWRTQSANWSEITTTVGLVFFMMVGAFFVDTDKSEGYDILGGLLLVIIIGVLLVAFGIIIRSAVNRLFKTKAYVAFLCHHKEGAGSLARYTKMRLASRTKKDIFLDSDCLEELDLIFDTVRTNSANVLILHTRLTYTRPWCAGEITSAIVNNVPIVQVACQDYIPPDNASLDTLDSLWSEQQKYAIGQYGLELNPMIKDALREMVKMEAATLDRFSKPTDWENSLQTAFDHLQNLTSEINAMTASISGKSKDDMTMPTKGARIVVLGSPQDAEIRTTCQVLTMMLQRKTQVVVATTLLVEEARAHMTSADYLLVVLSKGLLQDNTFAEVLVNYDQRRKKEPIEIVTVLADTNFAFPTPDYYKGLEEEGQGGKLLAGCFRKLLNILALPLTPLGSYAIINTQVDEICMRFRKCKQEATTSVYAVSDEYVPSVVTQQKTKAATIDSAPEDKLQPGDVIVEDAIAVGYL